MCAAISTRQRPGAGSCFGNPSRCLLQQRLALPGFPRLEQRWQPAHHAAAPASSAAPLWHQLFKYDVDGDGKLTYAEVQLLLADLQSSSTSASPATAAQAAAPATPPTVKSEPAKPAGPPKPLTYELQALQGLQDCHRQGRSWVQALIAYAATKLTNQHKSRAKASDLVWSALGMFVGVAALGTLALCVKTWPGVGHWHQQGLGLLLGSFGTLCVLIFGRPDAEPIRLWNLVVGHAVSIAVVMALVHTLKPGVVVRALAMAAMIAAMLWTDSVHPPGGALVLMTVDSPVIQSMGPWFLLYPSLFFCFGLLLPIGCGTNWLKRNVQFDFPTAAASTSAAPAASRADDTGDLKLKTA